jgi:dTDP-glucose 4,6-dehydratase
MRILVTGGLGTVGTVLVKELRKRGHEVWACDLAHNHDRLYVRCDVSKFRQIQQLISSHRFDYVYHLAAEFGRWNGEDYYENLWITNVVGTKNLLRLQETYRFRMIFFSSSEVYGDWDEVMSEHVMDNTEVRQLNDYAMTKWVSEMQVLNHSRMANTENVRVRLFNTYGPGEYYSPYRSVACRFAYSALHDLPYEVYLNHHRTSTYVTDTVRTLANIVNNFVPGEVYNIGGREYHDIKYLSDLILNYLHKSDDLVIYKESEPFTTKDKKIDISKAERDLGHRPIVSLEEGIGLTLQWMKDVYKETISCQESALSYPISTTTGTLGKQLIM